MESALSGDRSAWRLLCVEIALSGDRSEWMSLNNVPNTHGPLFKKRVFIY